MVLTKQSELEELLAQQIAGAGLPAPVRQHKFHQTRKWAIDFAWPQIRFAVEVDGGVWSGGRHTRGAGWEADQVKNAEAVLLGWRTMRFSGKQVKAGLALEYLRKVFCSEVPGQNTLEMTQELS